MKNSTNAAKRGGGGGVDDRLNVLPDELLLEIISSIPVKEAVRTSTLSHRWSKLHTLLPSTDTLLLISPLSINCNLPKLPRSCIPTKPRIRNKWFESVNTHLLSHRGIIRRCRIRNPVVFPGSVEYDKWIEDLMGKGIQELELNNLNWVCEVPSCLFAAKSLTVLDLKMCVIPDPLLSGEAVVGCVNLKTLKIKNMIFTELLLDNILSSCKQLETLHLLDFADSMTCTYSFRAWGLKHLLLHPSFDADVVSIDIDAPNLQTLRLTTVPQLENLDVHAPKVREVYIYLYKPRIELASRLNGFLASTKELMNLTLRGDSVQCLSQGEPQGFAILFQMLKNLSVSVDLTCEQQALFMVELLESCPQLRQLSLSIAEWHGVGSPVQFSKHRDRLRRLQCFTHHLEQVKLSGFMALTYQMKLTRLILEKAKVLKKMTIKLLRGCSMKRLTAVKDLLSLKNASTQGILISHTNRHIQRS